MTNEEYWADLRAQMARHKEASDDYALCARRREEELKDLRVLLQAAQEEIRRMEHVATLAKERGDRAEAELAAEKVRRASLEDDLDNLRYSEGKLEGALCAERAAHAELKEFHEHVAGANEAKRRQIEHLSSELLTEEADHAETKAKLQTARTDALEEAAKWMRESLEMDWQVERDDAANAMLSALTGDTHE